MPVGDGVCCCVGNDVGIIGVIYTVGKGEILTVGISVALGVAPDDSSAFERMIFSSVFEVRMTGKRISNIKKNIKDIFSGFFIFFISYIYTILNSCLIRQVFYSFS